MLGDWVLYGGKPVQVLQLTHEKFYVGFSPIPLTEEILRKNILSPEEMAWWPLADGSFRVEMQDDTHLIIGKYNYVHELQHALRLFGKEGEIKLWGYTDENEPEERRAYRVKCKHLSEYEDICYLRSHHGPNGGITMSCVASANCPRMKRYDKLHKQ